MSSEVSGQSGISPNPEPLSPRAAGALGVALLGTGMWARRVAAAVGRVPGLRLVTCYSRDAAAREAFAAAHGCEPAASLAAAIGHPAVSGALLITPNHTHAEQALACAAAGRHVFVEKPIADTLAAGRAMAAACEAAGVTLMVGHGFRRLGAARAVRRLIDRGALGQVTLAEANFSLPGTLTPDKWRAHRATCAGGPLSQLGIHQIDTLLSWLGPAAAVSGSFAHVATSADIDDVGSITLRLASGAIAVVSGSYVAPRSFWLRLYGSEANLEYRTDMRIWPEETRMDEATTLTIQTRAGVEPVAFAPADMLAEELAEFAACMGGAARPETGAAEGLAALAVIEGALAAHQAGRVVDLG